MWIFITRHWRTIIRDNGITIFIWILIPIIGIVFCKWTLVITIKIGIVIHIKKVVTVVVSVYNIGHIVIISGIQCCFLIITS